jgi:hypothetical protein
VRPLDRALVGAGDLARVDRLQGAEARRGEVAGDAVHAQAIGAVGRHLDLDHRVVEAERLGGRHADDGVGGQVDDAAVVVAELQLAARAQHAVALLAADLAGLERDAGAGNEAAGRGEDALHAGARVGRAAHDLDDRAGAGVDLAQPQAIGVGMLHGLDDMADDEALQRFGRVADALDLEAQHGEAVAQLGQARGGVEMLAEPGQGELHRTCSRAEKP